jgi:hypothetical protein
VLDDSLRDRADRVAPILGSRAMEERVGMALLGGAVAIAIAIAMVVIGRPRKDDSQIRILQNQAAAQLWVLVCLGFFVLGVASLTSALLGGE